MTTAQPAPAPSETAPDDEKYLVTSGDFFLGPILFTDKGKAQALADKHPGHTVRPLSEVLAENAAAA